MIRLIPGTIIASKAPVGVNLIAPTQELVLVTHEEPECCKSSKVVAGRHEKRHRGPPDRTSRQVFCTWETLN